MWCLFFCMSESDAQKIANILEPYTRHKRSCSIDRSLSSAPRGDFCDCGLGDAVEKINSILNDE